MSGCQRNGADPPRDGASCIFRNFQNFRDFLVSQTRARRVCERNVVASHVTAEGPKWILTAAYWRQGLAKPGGRVDSSKELRQPALPYLSFVNRVTLSEVSRWHGRDSRNRLVVDRQRGASVGVRCELDYLRCCHRLRGRDRATERPIGPTTAKRQLAFVENRPAPESGDDTEQSPGSGYDS